MKLTALEIRYIRGFGEPTIIDLDPEVTALTGANDVGKSAVLRAIELLCQFRDNRFCEETDVNLDRMFQVTPRWQEDKELGVTATFQITNASIGHFSGLVSRADIKFPKSAR